MRPKWVVCYLLLLHPVVYNLAFRGQAREPITVPRLHSPAARIIGERIRDARRAEGISMDDLSELSEVSLTSVGKIERGAQSPTAETLIRLASALSIDPGLLISGITADDFGYRSHQLTARELIRERRARSGGTPPPSD